MQWDALNAGIMKFYIDFALDLVYMILNFIVFEMQMQLI